MELMHKLFKTTSFRQSMPTVATLEKLTDKFRWIKQEYLGDGRVQIDISRSLETPYGQSFLAWDILLHDTEWRLHDTRLLFGLFRDLYFHREVQPALVGQLRATFQMDFAREQSRLITGTCIIDDNAHYGGVYESPIDLPRTGNRMPIDGSFEDPMLLLDLFTSDDGEEVGEILSWVSGRKPFLYLPKKEQAELVVSLGTIYSSDHFAVKFSSPADDFIYRGISIKKIR